MPTEPREFDLVLWGATGFTGRLVAEHLLARHGSGGSLRWAVGGRNRAKLEGVVAALGDGATGLPLVLGDGDDDAAMQALARRTRVVCTTVGPYARYGSQLVAACAAAGTDYCDLTGELHWMRRMIDSHEAEARASGARIVHNCGFDCIPSDLGVLFLQQQMRERHGACSPHVKGRVRSFRGGFSGGTAASMLGMMEALAADPALRRLMADPYALNPEGQRSGPDRGDVTGPARDPDFGAWTGPFVMAAINTRVVRRSNALSGYAYGRDFRYDEAMLTGAGAAGFARAASLSALLAAALVAGAVGPLRRQLGRRLPAPGEGPSAAEREAGFFDIAFCGAHPQDAAAGLRTRVTGDRDPGYGATARMLGEAAACLAQDEPAVEGGFWTPATALGAALIARLRAHAGMEFAVEDPAPGGSGQ